MSQSYPVYPANSLTNNNIHNWPLPNNGTCSPAEFCDAIFINRIRFLLIEWILVFGMVRMEIARGELIGGKKGQKLEKNIH